jgi:hypothetical protein
MYNLGVLNWQKLEWNGKFFSHSFEHEMTDSYMREWLVQLKDV